MRSILQQTAAARSECGLSARRLCPRARLSRATLGRWRRRERCGQPLLGRPGPPKLGPLPLAQVRVQIQQLEHGSRRTQGTGALYREHREALSRRELNALILEERQRQQRQRRERLRRITWYSAQTAWALDATEWPTSQPGVKLQVLAARDLASNYGLGLWALPQLRGPWVAQAMDQLIRRHGPPLFLKRDNGAPLHTPAVEEVLARAAVLPLDSPAYYPQYNGGIEKHIGDLKRLFPYPLPETCAADLPQAQALLEAIRHEFNARPRPGLADCSTAEMFYAGPRLRVDRPTRTSIFESLCQQTRRIFRHMKTRDQRTFATAWRVAALSWLRRQALIGVSTHHQPQSNQQLLLPLFSEKWSH